MEKEYNFYDLTFLSIIIAGFLVIMWWWVIKSPKDQNPGAFNTEGGTLNDQSHDTPNTKEIQTVSILIITPVLYFGLRVRKFETQPIWLYEQEPEGELISRQLGVYVRRWNQWAFGGL